MRDRFSTGALALLTALLTFGTGARAADDAVLPAEELSRIEARLVSLAAEATPKTVMVQGLIGLGTGAVVDARGTVFTNAHVAAGARYAILMHPDGRRELARRKGIDYERDLAVLVPVAPPQEPVPYFEPRTERPEVGTWVAALGYPGGPRGDARPTFTVGRVVEGSGLSNVMGLLDYENAIRVDAPIFSGNSGGPLIDMEGRLVGINGAVDFGGDEVGGLAIPAALVLERTRDLDHGLVRLPGGIELDPREVRLLQLLDERLDAFVKEAMEAQLGGRMAMPEAVGALLGGAKPDPNALRERARLVERLLEKVTVQGRNRVLLASLGRGLPGDYARPVRLTDEDGHEGLATLVRGLGYVACASSFGAAAERLATPNGEGLRVVRRDARHDVLLLAPDRKSAPQAGFEPAGDAPPVGSLVLVLDERGAHAAGVLSASARSVPVHAAAMLADAQPSTALKIVRGFVDLAELLEQNEVAELGRQILRAFELREAFSAGSPLRPYERVISIDAPVSPADAGAPVVGRDGTLLGICVANAHLGTSYAVPVDTLREVLGGDREAKPVKDRKPKPGTEDAPPKRRPSPTREPDLF